MSVFSGSVHAKSPCFYYRIRNHPVTYSVSSHKLKTIRFTDLILRSLYCTSPTTERKIYDLTFFKTPQQNPMNGFCSPYITPEVFKTS
ncbi:MAG: hypothetical protein K0Q53_2832 [Massilibacillus sp.]|nr:hypothetical protein [Massilibacillus sp.]